MAPSSAAAKTVFTFPSTERKRQAEGIVHALGRDEGKGKMKKNVDVNEEYKKLRRGIKVSGVLAIGALICTLTAFILRIGMWCGAW